MRNPTILVISHDGFQDAWKPALSCLEKFWPDCNWDVRTISNHIPWGKAPLTIGMDHGWANNLKTALNQIESDLVICWLEDMLICRPVNHAECVIYSNLMKCDDNLVAIRLGQGNELTDGNVFGYAGQFLSYVSIDSDYRISTSPTLWRVSYLRQILDNCGHTAWDFETTGTEYSRKIPGVIAVPQGKDDTTRPIRCYYTGITRGKWDTRCIAWLKSIGIEVEDQSRGFMQLP